MTRNQRLVIVADCVVLGAGLIAAGFVLDNLWLGLIGPVLLVIGALFWWAGGEGR